jgi:hypothetical protein
MMEWLARKKEKKKGRTKERRVLFTKRDIEKDSTT